MVKRRKLKKDWTRALAELQDFRFDHISKIQSLTARLEGLEQSSFDLSVRLQDTICEVKQKNFSKKLQEKIILWREKDCGDPQFMKNKTPWLPWARIEKELEVRDFCAVKIQFIWRLRKERQKYKRFERAVAREVAKLKFQKEVKKVVLIQAQVRMLLARLEYRKMKRAVMIIEMCYYRHLQRKRLQNRPKPEPSKSSFYARTSSTLLSPLESISTMSSAIVGKRQDIIAEAWKGKKQEQGCVVELLHGAKDVPLPTQRACETTSAPPAPLVQGVARKMSAEEESRAAALQKMSAEDEERTAALLQGLARKISAEEERVASYLQGVTRNMTVEEEERMPAPLQGVTRNMSVEEEERAALRQGVTRNMSAEEEERAALRQGVTRKMSAEEEERAAALRKMTEEVERMPVLRQGATRKMLVEEERAAAALLQRVKALAESADNISDFVPRDGTINDITTSLDATFKEFLSKRETPTAEVPYLPHRMNQPLPPLGPTAPGSPDDLPPVEEDSKIRDITASLDLSFKRFRSEQEVWEEEEEEEPARGPNGRLDSGTAADAKVYVSFDENLFTIRKLQAELDSELASLGKKYQ